MPDDTQSQAGPAKRPVTDPVSQNGNAPEAGDAAQRPDPKTLTPAAQRALAEAEERRRARDGTAGTPQRELGGRAGPDPVRYGDWENGGITSDF